MHYRSVAAGWLVLMAGVRGDKELRKALRKVSTAPTGRVLDNLCAQALAPMRETIDTLAPRPSLKGTAVIAKKVSRGSTFRVFWIAFRGMGLRIAHLVELGTAPHSLAKGASRRYGIMQDVPPFHPGTPPEPFVRPGYEATREETIAAVGRGLWGALVSSMGGKK
jgi:hypothetical protein